MLNNLSNELKINIYSYLDFKFVCRFESNRELLENIISSQNPIKSKKTIFNNYILNKCYHCSKSLTSTYIINICSHCQYNINKHKIYSKFCDECIELNDNITVYNSECIMCSNKTFFIRSEPYS